MKKIIITDKQKKQVEALAGYGMSDKDIANVVGLSESTLQRHCREPLEQGRAKAKSQVSQTAFQMAVSGKQPAMTMFWLKTQCRWREVHEPDPSAQDNSQPKVVILRIPDNGRETTKE